MIFSHAGLQGGGRKKAPEQQPGAAAQEPTPTATPVDVQVLPGMELPGTEAEPAPPPRAPSPDAKVQRVWIWQETNDCLWKMAKDHYGDPFLWPKIYEANRAQIKDPAVIFPKQQILIPPLEDVVSLPRPAVPAVPAPVSAPEPKAPPAEEKLEIPAWLLEPEPAPPVDPGLEAPPVLLEEPALEAPAEEAPAEEGEPEQEIPTLPLE